MLEDYIRVLGVGFRHPTSVVRTNGKAVPTYTAWTNLLSNFKRDGTVTFCKTLAIYEKFVKWAKDNGYVEGETCVRHFCKGTEHASVKHLVVVKNEHRHSFRIPQERSDCALWVVDPGNRFLYHYHEDCSTTVSGTKLRQCENEQAAQAGALQIRSKRIEKIANQYVGGNKAKLLLLSDVYKELSESGEIQTRETINKALISATFK